ncbi:zinc-responsive transcriptional regulator [Streptomyces sp. YIM 130001]|nr:zinc-responsive transcriptional regulator [Streptomyces sp. YIM 130001]
MNDAELLAIGAFAARARLSPKALRLYDRRGLLPPAHVDGPSGYRHYRASQAERARLVAQLRQLDMPLALIAEVVALPGPEAAGALSAYWAGVEERLAGQRALADYLRGRLSGRSSDMYGKFTVETTESPEQFVITESRHILADHLPTFIPESLGRLERAAEEHCGGIAGVPFMAYHAEVSQESDGPAESCVPVAGPVAARAWAEGYGRGVRARAEPATRLAFTRITKAQVAYPQIGPAFEAVEEWIAREGLEVAGPCREIYFTNWPATAPDEPACDIAFPVRERTVQG